ncbi:MAG: T9SS type A sorting domain-containing protein [candidate division WOR-3 bacterium]
MFEPNGKLLNFLIDTLYNFIINTYPPTWNRDIVMILHSRASLESEVAIYKYGNRHVKRVISIGGLFFGSKLADVCSSPSDIDLNCWHYIDNDTLFIMCMFIKTLMAALNISVGNICALISTPDIWRMTPEAVITSHRPYIDPYISSRTDVNYYVGIGWTPEWKCGPFSGKSQVGCLILRYLLGQGCNDAVIEYSSSFNRSRYENTCFISTLASCGSPFPWSCGGYPEEWERDHTQSKSDYNIYARYVKGAIFGACPSRLKPQPFDIPITSPKLVGSNAFFAKVDSFISILLSPRTDSILVISDNPINIMNAHRIRPISVDNMYGYIVYPQSTGANIMISKRNDDVPEPYYDGTNIAIFYPSSYVAKVKFDKTIYRQGDRGTIDVIYPLADSVWGLYWRVGDPRSVGFIRFSSVGDTFRTSINFLFSGVYKFILQTFGKEPRTIIENIWVVSGYDTESFLSFISNMENGIYDTDYKGSEVKFLTSREYINVGSPGYYRIYDIRGSLVSRGFSKDGKVFVGNLKRGIYFIQIGKKTFKIIKR